jgi:ATP-dependent DNA ligase
MEEYKVKQIQPNHADHVSGYREKYLQEMLDYEAVVAQPKYDGERMLIHINHEEVYCTSRRHSKKTDRFMENQDKLPDLCEACKSFDLDYTVIDCECYAKDWSTIVGILHSLPERAIELSKRNVPRFAVFDCLFYDGKDLRLLPYCDRLLCVAKVVHKINYEPMHVVKFINEELKPDDIKNLHYLSRVDEFDTAMKNAINMGWEGIVVKSLFRTYYDVGASIKCKKFETVDCVVCGYDVGRGKYSDTVGALHIGYYDPDSDSIIKISNVNCGTDEERNMWRDHWTELKNSVIEVKCQEITEKSLRHPVYIRLRDDKDYKMCIRSTIFKES